MLSSVNALPDPRTPTQSTHTFIQNERATNKRNPQRGREKRTEGKNGKREERKHTDRRQKGRKYRVSL